MNKKEIEEQVIKMAEEIGKIGIKCKDFCGYPHVAAVGWEAPNGTDASTREEQIEEMAVIGCVRNPQAHTAEECAKCEFKEGQCNAYRHAKALYDTGYRKTFTSDLASDTQKAFKEGCEKGCETCEQSWDNGYNDGYNDGYESGKEDGIKEFGDKIKAKLFSVFGKTICSDLDTEDIADIIDEVLKEA